MSFQTDPFPPFIGGEDTASQVLVVPGGLSRRVENGRFTGAGRIQQIEDWRLADIAKNLAGTPVENHAVCGIFPFSTQGGASAASAGVAFSFNATTDIIYLHQLGEDGAILRTFNAYTSYTETAPPQMTGVEMFGKFYFCEYGREAATSRKGYAVFDPTGAGSVTIPTFDLVSGGVAAAALRARGLCSHRGASLALWGYRNEESGNVDAPHIFRLSKYGAPDTHVPDTSETSATDIVVGRLNVPIVACGQSGNYTILGKEDEVFALYGDFGPHLGYTDIGKHGPCSTAGLASNGSLAVWMSREGPALSDGGGKVQLLHMDRLTKRLLTYHDLAYTCAVHDTPRTRIGFLLRRRSTLLGSALTSFWADQVLWWDYERDDFTVQGTPTTCFAIGTIKGPGITLAAPSGTPASLTETVGATSAALAWTHSGGDVNAQIFLEYKLTSVGTYTVVGPLSPGTLAWTLTGLAAATSYDWRLRYFKNGVYGSYTAAETFVTSAAGIAAQPTSFTYDGAGSQSIAGDTYWTMNLAWVQQEFAALAFTDLYEGVNATFALASVIQTMDASVVSASVQKIESTTPYYYWIVHRLRSGVNSTETPLSGHPVQFNAAYLSA